MSNRLFVSLGTWPWIGVEIALKGFLGGKPVATELSAFHLALPQEVAEVALGVARELRCLLDRDPLGQRTLLGEQRK